MTKLSNTLYQSRRAHVMATLPKGSVAVLRTGGLCTRNNDCEYEFRPNSLFFYLTCTVCVYARVSNLQLFVR